MTAINTAAVPPRWADKATRAAIVARRRLGLLSASVRRSRTSIANSTLQVGGLACFDVSAFQVASPLGWAVIGVSAFVLAWLLQPAGAA